jgi:hypothetical protein
VVSGALTRSDSSCRSPFEGSCDTGWPQDMTTKATSDPSHPAQGSGRVYDFRSLHLRRSASDTNARRAGNGTGVQIRPDHSLVKTHQSASPVDDTRSDCVERTLLLGTEHYIRP